MFRFLRQIGNIIGLFCAIYRKALMSIYRYRFLAVGRNVNFCPYSFFTYDKITLGNNVSISRGAHFSATDARIDVHDNVMFGPNVTIITGDHNTGEVGQFMSDVQIKRPEDDRPVLIETDVWVGAGVTILKGVTIGRGSIIAAGALVTRNVPAYAIAKGVPAVVSSYRFSAQEIERHEKKLAENTQRNASR